MQKIPSSRDILRSAKAISGHSFENRTPSRAWNRNLFVGQKEPFTKLQVIELVKVLQTGREHRNLCLAALGIDTMLRGSDLLSLTAQDLLTDKGEIRSKLKIKQQKVGEGVVVFLSPFTRTVCARWLLVSKKTSTNYLFTSKRGKSNIPIATRDFRRIVKKWAQAINLEPADYSGHSLRRTKPAFLFSQGVSIELIRLLLGHASIKSTQNYLAVSRQQALAVASEHDIFTKPRSKDHV